MSPSKSSPPRLQAAPSPAVIVRVADRQADAELGPLLAVYQGRRLGWGDIWLWILPGILAVLAPIGYGFDRATYGYTHYGPMAADAWSLPWFLLATLAVIVLATLAVMRLRQARPYVRLHAHGLRLRPGAWRAYRLPWNEIAGIATDMSQEDFLGLPVRRHYRAILFLSIGRPVELTSPLQNLPELVTRLKANLYPRLTYGLQNSFQAGQWVFFGRVAIQSQAIRLSGRKAGKAQPPAIPWKEVHQVFVRSGYLMIELKDPKASRAALRVPVSQIPNLEILLQLIQQGVNL